MIRKLLNSYNPQYLVFVWESKGKAARHRIKTRLEERFLLDKLLFYYARAGGSSENIPRSCLGIGTASLQDLYDHLDQRRLLLTQSKANREQLFILRTYGTTCVGSQCSEVHWKKAFFQKLKFKSLLKGAESLPESVVTFPQRNFK